MAWLGTNELTDGQQSQTQRGVNLLLFSRVFLEWLRWVESLSGCVELSRSTKYTMLARGVRLPSPTVLTDVH